MLNNSVSDSFDAQFFYGALQSPHPPTSQQPSPNLWRWGETGGEKNRVAHSTLFEKDRVAHSTLFEKKLNL